MLLTKVRNFLFGKPRDLFDRSIRKNISLVAFLAWVGLGADGISSSCYGPEEAFVALGSHTELAIYLAIATAITVFIISYAYTQVIDLFPNGGGGYRVANRLLGKYAGLVSGSALVVDYILTIAISVTSSTDALLSFLPDKFHSAKIIIAVLFVIFLAILNMRGMKESIKFLLPIFLGFVITHFCLIVYGIYAQRSGLGNIMPAAYKESSDITQYSGIIFLISLFLKAFSMGGGTYTGLEAVSNNVHHISEPRVKNGRLTMFLVAISLAFMASGIILLYLLWGVQKVQGETLNATIFYAITNNWNINGYDLGPIAVPIILILEALLLIVAANSGFLAGPTVVANMANDEWMPRMFSSLSSRLVIKNGIIFMMVAAISTIIVTKGSVHILVVLYSINVFITFSLSMLGLMFHWARHRNKPKSKSKFTISFIGFIVCFGILITTIFEKFYEGGWITLVITSILVVIGFFIKRKYTDFKTRLLAKETQFSQYENIEAPRYDFIIDKNQPTAAIIIDQTFGSGIHCLLEIQKLFPGIFKNFLFVMAGDVDYNNFGEEKKWREMRDKTRRVLRKCKNYCDANNLTSKAYIGYGTDTVDKLTQLTDRLRKDYKNVVFFGTKFVFDYENFITQMLFNHLAYVMQRRLNIKGSSMVILPMKI